MNDIKGLESWQDETEEWSRHAGAMKTRAGIGTVDALEAWYAQWKQKKTERNRREYMLWRLRLHLKHNGDPVFLQELNDIFDIGLHDEEVGPSYWQIPPEPASAFSDGFNWRRDSGAAIQGGSKNKTVAKEARKEFTEDEN